MLAQNFKSATELNLSEKERDALIKTLKLFETGRVKHIRYYEGEFELGGNQIIPFNMNCWEHPTSCGTVQCIGGTAEMIGGVHFNRSGWCMQRNPSRQIYDLFFPNDPIDYLSITVEQAARALRNYLTNGKADWSSVLE